MILAVVGEVEVVAAVGEIAVGVWKETRRENNDGESD